MRFTMVNFFSFFYTIVVWPQPKYRCDALPTELWSHTLGARSIYWVHFSREEWQLVEHRSGVSRRSRVRIPLKPWIFQTSSFQLLKLENQLRWSFFTSSTTTVQIWIISYILHIMSLLTGEMTSLPMCGFIAQLVEHRTGIAEVMGSNPVEALIFSGFFFPIA